MIIRDSLFDIFPFLMLLYDALEELEPSFNGDIISLLLREVLEIGGLF